MLVLQNAGERRLALPGLELTPILLEAERRAKFDLTLNAQETDGDASPVGWLYNARPVRRGDDRAPVGPPGAAAGPRRSPTPTRIVDLPLLTPAEERQIQDWNATAAAYLTEALPARADRGSGRAHPDRPAVIFEGDRADLRASSMPRRPLSPSA